MSLPLQLPPSVLKFIENTYAIYSAAWENSSEVNKLPKAKKISLAEQESDIDLPYYLELLNFRRLCRDVCNSGKRDPYLEKFAKRSDGESVAAWSEESKKSIHNVFVLSRECYVWV